MLGRKVKCPTCGTAFVSEAADEDDADEEAPRPKKKPAAEREDPPSRRRPAPPPDEDEDDAEEEEERPRARRRRDEDDEDDRPSRRRNPHRGGMVLTLGIVSIAMLFVACGGGMIPVIGPFAAPTLLIAGVVLGITSWVMGSGDLKQINARRMDPSGKGTTTGGYVCGIVGTVLNALSLLCCILSL